MNFWLGRKRKREEQQAQTIKRNLLKGILQKKWQQKHKSKP